MGAPVLLSSVRRKTNKASVAPPPLSARQPAAWLRPSSKSNARPENNEGAGSVGAAQPFNTKAQLRPSRQNSKYQHNSGIKQKRAMSLNISSDAESESMQVMIVPESPPTTEVKNLKDVENNGEDRCIYTVGNDEYLVKHVNGNYVKQQGGDPIERSMNVKFFNVQAPTKTNAILEESKEAAAEGGGSEKKKKSRFSPFKKSPKKKGSSAGDEEQGSGNNNNDQNGDKKDDKGDSKDNGKDEKKDSGSDDNNNGKHCPGEEIAFTPERIQFATESTLPIHPGSESTAPKEHPSWTPVDGTEFKVRTGPNYPKNGKKEASLTSLYEVYCVRYFRSEKRTLGGATRIMPLPEMGTRDAIKEGDADATEEKTDGDVAKVVHHPELKDTNIPDVLVVHFMLPYEPPNMFKQKDDGPGGECVYYLRPSQRFLHEISGQKPATPATLLFARWCAECKGDLKMRSRFKCMALVRDIDKHNFGLLKTYNGKPVLITESGRVGSGLQGGMRYLEMTANVHHWAFMAKKGFVSLIPKFANMQMEVGFTIEAHTDAEMPECMLGSTVLSYINETTGPMITSEIQEPVHEHQA
mmetsp:Transcript_25256/g.53778  ORF Transcript_25256/g.53778 Transcript_25256/m.53778 type:complete len:581 (-) Transcript_25256:461-2203(-)